MPSYAPFLAKPTPKSAIQNPFLEYHSVESFQESPIYVKTHNLCQQDSPKLQETSTNINEYQDTMTLQSHQIFNQEPTYQDSYEDPLILFFISMMIPCHLKRKVSFEDPFMNHLLMKIMISLLSPLMIQFKSRGKCNSQ